MKSTVAVSPDFSPDKSSRFYLVKWFNNLLKTSFEDVQEMGSGACHCQMMEHILPGSVDLARVRFDAQNEDDCKHNFSLLNEAFNKNGIARRLQVDKLIKGDFKSNFEILKWFKGFYTANVKSGEYDPVKARCSQLISPIEVSPEFVRTKVRLFPEDTGNLPHPYTKKWKDIFDWADRSPIGDHYTYCSSCKSHLSTSSRGLADLRRHVETKKHKKRSGLMNRQVAELLPCSDATLRFIYNRCYSGSAEGEEVSRRFARHKLGMEYPKNITSACQNTPYCLYIYGGVTSGDEETVSVVLVGFFDVESSSHCIRFLEALQTDGTGDQTASLVVETLKKFGLSMENLVAVYFTGHGAASEQIYWQLRELNPNIISLGGLFTIADAACRAGIKELSNQAQEFIVDLHAYYCSSSDGNENLKSIFRSDIKEQSVPFYLNISCHRFCELLTKLLEAWEDLTLYFSTCQDNGKKPKSICSQLKDPKVKATFLFLEQALKSLHSFQKKTQESSRADMLLILEEASSLLSTYTSYFLDPHAAADILKDRDTQILHEKKFHLPSSKLSLGAKTVEDFVKNSAAEALPLLKEEALSFYIALTGCIAEELPLNETVLKTIAMLLNPKSMVTVTEEVVGGLATKLGLCNSPDKVKQLTRDFLQYQLSQKEEGEENVKDGCTVGSPEKNLASVLQDTQPTSVFRRLILILLCFPCPSLDTQQVLTEALQRSTDFSFSESDSFTEDECGISLDSVFHSSSNEDLQVFPRRKKKNACLGQKDVPLEWTHCEVRLTRVDELANEFGHIPGENCISWKQEPCRGNFGWESSLRQKPKARTVFQAGGSTWSKPIQLDKVSKNVHDLLEKTSPGKTSPTRGQQKKAYQDGKGFLLEELVWGKGEGFSWWPGVVRPWILESVPRRGMRRVEWFGDATFSEINAGSLRPFGAFNEYFSKESFDNNVPFYKNAIYEVMELASYRCGKSFASASGDNEKELDLMLDWASKGFLPSGQDGFLPSGFQDPSAVLSSSDSALSDYQPPAKRKCLKNKTNGTVITNKTKLEWNKIKECGKSIKDICLSCGLTDCEVQHPLFEGGLCLNCKERFSETFFRVDPNRNQLYCSVCCSVPNVVRCHVDSCHRGFCKSCVNQLVGPNTFDKLKDVDRWSCYICKPSQCKGDLKLRPNWNVKLQQFFATDSGLEFEPHRIYPSIPANQRRPIRVLSLFDGISTGCQVLKSLGFKIKSYIASEISEDAIVVSMVKHEGEITHVNDIRTITRKHLKEWGPFDLLIGASPCNDLSLVNPQRKGLYDGTGKLFFEFYRILSMLRPSEDDPRPFFWLFENVASMTAHDKKDICRFLECNPVLLNAVDVSPANRPRLFWGNLPGMRRPITPSQDDKLVLQDCLEPGRLARVDKIRTVTTKSNSIRQDKSGSLPVSMNGKDDYLWCTEIEQVFGFPKHYTDVNNMGRSQRQKVLGVSWSIPVIRHLLAPLRDYYECK
ncbi:uncharacterized protein KZ484_015140 [Pholidichthys leucotaenia]